MTSVKTKWFSRAGNRLVIETIIVLLSMTASSRSLSAQKLAIKCIADDTQVEKPCSEVLSATAPLQKQSMRVRAVDSANKGVANATLAFFATSGRVIPDTTTTDADGYAYATWSRERSSSSVAVTIHARTQSASAFKEMSFEVEKPAVQYGLEIVDRTNNQTSFEKSPLARTVKVRLLRFDSIDNKQGAIVTNAERCLSYRVAFTQIGKGFISPDTVIMWHEEEADGIGDGDGCFAYANWTLPDGAGTRDARATLIGSNVLGTQGTKEFEAFARGLPKVIGGAVVTRYAGYYGIRKGTSAAAKIERVLGDGTTFTRDTTLRISRDTLQHNEAEWRPAAFLGVSAPIIPRLHRLSLTVGVDLNSPMRDWYFGASVVRAIGGLVTEALPVDAHILAHVGRVDEIVDQTACSVNQNCTTRLKTRFHGLSGMVSVELSSLVSEVLKKLGI